MLISVFCAENAFVIMLLFNYFYVLKSEDPLIDVNWKRHVNGTSSPKYWLNYIHKSIERIINNYTCTNVVLANAANYMSKRPMYYHFHFGKVVHPQIQCGDKEPSIEMAPSFQSQLYWYNIDGCISSSKYLVTFIVYSQLRLNITFIKLKLREVFGRCLRYSLIESMALNNSVDTFVLCCIHSQFSVYPTSNNINFKVELYRYVPVDLHVVFCVISRNVINSKMALDNNVNSPDAETFSIYYILTTRTVYFTHRIQIKKNTWDLYCVLVPAVLVTQLFILVQAFYLRNWR